MKRIYEVSFSARYIDTDPGGKKIGSYDEDETVSIIEGEDGEKAIAKAKKKALNTVTRCSYPDENEKPVRYVSKCVGFKLTSLKVKAEAEG